MQVQLTDDQALVLETATRFVEAELPLPDTRRFHDDAVGYDPAWLAKSAELGWFGMLVPEELGGGCVSDHGLTDAAIIAEVLGRAVQPGPFLGMNVVAHAIATAGSERLRDEVLPGVVAGETPAAWAWADERGEFDQGVSTRSDGDAIVLSGRRGFVVEGPSARLLLVAAAVDGNPVHVLVPADADGVAVTALSSLDLSRRFAHVSFDDVRVGADSVVTVDTTSLLSVALPLLLAETVGALDVLFDMTVDYAKDRIAFGRPIGSFQAIKHMLADEAMYLETCKAAAVAATRAVAEGADDAASTLHAAAAYVGERGPALAQTCLQVHGGIGYTWEHDLHLLMRRVQSNASLLGTPTWHRERLCAENDFGGAR